MNNSYNSFGILFGRMNYLVHNVCFFLQLNRAFGCNFSSMFEFEIVHLDKRKGVYYVSENCLR